MPLSRRDLLGRAAATVVLWSGGRTFARTPGEAAAARVFPASVASGDPTASGAVVWTQIAPASHVPGRDLVLEVATDPDFRDVVVSEGIPAAAIGPERDWTVCVDLDGRLAANRRYAYRFGYGGVRSRTGRLRTLPAPDAEPASLRLALVACQDYVRGWFNAYDDIAREELDYILHVGDFIYETLSPLARRRLTLPSGGSFAVDLADFRTLHRTYRSDPALQRALERHTLIATWDDHEVANDRYWDRVAGRLRAPGHPLDGDPAASDRMHAGGIRAWWEYMPVRVPYDDAVASPRDRLHIERAFRFGTLAELFVTDERLRRDAHPCGEGGAGERAYKMDATCPGRMAADRTMLGDAQRRWLVDGVAGSTARWKLWANSVPMTPIGYGGGSGRLFLTLDTWTGYEYERRAILGELAARKVTNLVSLTGDIHTFFAARLLADEVDPLRPSSAPVGVELGTGTLSSITLGEIGGASTHRDAVLPSNPQLAFWSPAANGYAIVTVTGDALLYEPRGFAVDRVVDPATATVLGRCRVASGIADVVPA
jgi:alkaline phosphatase D